MASTKELRDALARSVFPLLQHEGFVRDASVSRLFTTWRRAAGEHIEVVEFQWHKRGRPRFRLSACKFGAGGTTAAGLHFGPGEAGPGQAPRYVVIHPAGNGASTRDWFCQDRSLLARMLFMRLRPASSVTQQVLVLWPELEGYLRNGTVGPHCIEKVNRPFESVRHA
jgi:hypothetical protein